MHRVILYYQMVGNLGSSIIMQYNELHNALFSILLNDLLAEPVVEKLQSISIMMFPVYMQLPNVYNPFQVLLSQQVDIEEIKLKMRQVIIECSGSIIEINSISTTLGQCRRPRASSSTTTMTRLRCFVRGDLSV